MWCDILIFCLIHSYPLSPHATIYRPFVNQQTNKLTRSKNPSLCHSLSPSPPLSLLTLLSSLSSTPFWDLLLLPHLSLSLCLMATVLESIAVPRASVFPSSTIFASSSRASPLSSSRVSLKTPELRGLKLRIGLSTRTVRSASSRSGIVRRAGRIVCESSEATVQC